MKTLLKTWLPAMGILALCALIYLIFNWSMLTLTHKLSFYALIVLVLHLFEEERFPGGFGYLFNMIRSKSEVPDRYPMNPVIAMTVDVLVIFILFSPPLFYPSVYWLGVAPMFVAVMELLSHGGLGILQWQKKDTSIYNPGLITAIALSSIGVTYITVVSSQNLMIEKDWLWAVLYFIAAMIIGLVIPEFGMRSKTAKWGFDHEHFLGYYKKYTTLEEVFKKE